MVKTDTGAHPRLGDPASTPAGEKPQVFEPLAHADPNFTQFTWFGFSSTGQPGSVFYVDNLRLE